jgi:hypothetical protein
MERIKGIKANFWKYVVEIFIIFVGISISFLFDEWRTRRNDKELLVKHLSELKGNLIQDTIILSGAELISKKLVRASKRLLDFRQQSEIVDSLDFFIDGAASYADFYAKQSAFEELKQTARTSLISDDSLKILLLSYYTTYVPHCREWCTVNKSYTMDQLIPEMTNFFPVVPDPMNVVTANEKVKALKIKKLRNLLLTSVTYKQESLRVLLMTKSKAKQLLEKIEAELKKR